ncbi:YciI family protein [Flavisolibacter tropicus]|uniref:GTP cyclohydrolase n=1 Tax=Flavisolibacter tropicus TaxID=1492898 RepID=A0A172TW59_9BACT|nr:YciI family protein [Flavisolibacter tropicus]ANE51134.1 GTP cyclohydrolase [Flavisolibacter tropicus]
MFIVELTYNAPLEQIDVHLAAHVQFLDKFYGSGNFIVSGRKVPRDGGIILAAAKSKSEVEKIIAEDPFYKHQLAEYKITEFIPSKQAHNIQERIA